MAQQQHPFHLVNPSPWPVLSAFSMLFVATGAVLFMHKNIIGHYLLPASLFAIFFCMYCWWRDVLKEAIVEKAHNTIVQNGLRFGMSLFILSEIMFFFAFFFAYFMSAFNPAGILEGVWTVTAGTWPPKNIVSFDPWHLPLFNTLLLLLSGTTVTWAHYALLNNQRKDAIDALTITVILGVIFSICQALEYAHAPFGFHDGIYASNFYMATGFHGFHVIVGTIFLAICLLRIKKGHMDSENHVGFECAAWYWHFVDVVWLFLFVFIYVWGR